MSTAQYVAASQEQVKAIQDEVEANPSVMVRDLARRFKLSERAVVEALPAGMCRNISAHGFVTVWEAATEWEKVTFMAETPGAILEIGGKLPKGKIARGMYNLMDKSFALGGHLLMSEIEAIWLVSKPIFTIESHSIQFFTAQGQTAFSLYLGRDASKAIIPSVKEGYMSLWNECSGEEK